jgi:site-specific recombinase XerD
MPKEWSLRRERLLGREDWVVLHRYLLDRAALAEQRGGRRAVKEYILILFAAHTGLRRSEIAALKWRDLHLRNEAPFIVVRRGKGDQYREVAIGDELRRILKRFIRRMEVWGERTAPDDVVFLSQRGPYSGSGVARVFRNACQRSGIRVLNFHALRHFFGTNLHAATKDLRLVQKQLGHLRVTTTQVYVDVSSEDAVTGMAAFEKHISSEKKSVTGQRAETRAMRVAK